MNTNLIVFPTLDYSLFGVSSLRLTPHHAVISYCGRDVKLARDKVEGIEHQPYRLSQLAAERVQTPAWALNQ